MALLKATTRTGTGTRKTRALRAQGKIPGIIYGHGIAAAPVTLDGHEVVTALGHHERVLEIDLEGQTQSVLVKDVQYDYLGQDILHLDLTRVNLDERVEVTVSLTFRGEPAGAAEGGVLQVASNEVAIECPVRSIPEEIRVPVAELKLYDKLFARDLALPEGATLVDDPNMLIASVGMVHEVEEAAAEVAPAGPEVIGEKTEEEGAGEE
jgi:large subunit ribosomal protein L25